MLSLAQEFSSSVTAVAVVAFGAMICLVTLRAGRFPVSGRAVIAGTVAGLLIGPTVGGRVFPDQYERLFLGGVKQREALDYARWFAANVIPAMANSSIEAREAQRKSDEQNVADKRAALQRERWRHQQPMRIFAMSVVALTLLCATFGCVRAGDRRQGVVTPLSVGLWSFALPSAMAYFAALRWWGASVADAAMLAAAIGFGPWMAANVVERRIADDAEIGGARMMQTAGRIASGLAIALGMWSAWKSRGSEGVALVAPLLALPVAWLLATFQHGDQRADTSSASTIRHARFFAIESLMAMLAALVAIKIDLHAGSTKSLTMLAMVVVLALLADDGRWLGALIGAMLLGGRPGLRTMRLVMPAMAAGPTQLALTALALHASLLPERFALPLLAGVVLIETTAPARRSMAAQLAETEAAIDEKPID